MAGLDDVEAFKRKQYHLAAPASSRQPNPLYNKNVGGVYQSCGKITKKAIYTLNTLLNGIHFEMMSILCTMYHNRNNTIPNESAFGRNQIKGIFSCELINYKFSVNELYKRYCMRRNCLDKKAELYDFWALSETELDFFIRWLRKIGRISCSDEDLWIVSMGMENKWYLQLWSNSYTLALVQTINSLHDSLRLMESTPGFVDYIVKHEQTSRYHPC